MVDRVTCFLALGCASIGRAKFVDMQRDFHKIRVEHKKAVRAATKYKVDLFNCKNELKKATEMMRHREDSLLAAKKKKKYAQVERDRARADLEKAKGALSENEKALANTVREWNMLKAHVAGIGALVAHAWEEAIQEYKANFKDTDDYLDLTRDTVIEYKENLKRVDSSFDGDYYDRLILDEP